MALYMSPINGTVVIYPYCKLQTGGHPHGVDKDPVYP